MCKAMRCARERDPGKGAAQQVTGKVNEVNSDSVLGSTVSLHNPHGSIQASGLGVMIQIQPAGGP